MTIVVKRAYTGSTVQMFTVIDTMMANAKEHQSDLVQVISTYTMDYFNDLDNRIDSTTEAHFGKDAASNLRKATTLVNSMQQEALNDLSLFKTIIETQFALDPTFKKEVLKDLGFDSYYRLAQSRSQESLVLLLAQFRQHLSPEMKAKILAKGAQPALLDRLVAKGNELHTANVNQEVFKDNKKDDNVETITQFNGLFIEVMGIAKIAAKVYKDRLTLKDKFNYSKHLKALTGSASATTLAKKAKAKKALAVV